MDVRRIACLSALALMLNACGGERVSSSGAVADGPTGASTDAPAGAVIDDEDLSDGLMGVDVDHNGIRDDIDRLIARRYSSTPSLQRAAQQEAKALQAMLLATTTSGAMQVGDDVMRATQCAATQSRLDTEDGRKMFLQMVRQLIALTANTRERFSAYWHANRLAAGAVFEQPLQPSCDGAGS